MAEQRMEFRAEVSRLLDIVVHSLYSEKEIFLRELISNASDACDKLRYQALTRPELTGEEPDYKISISVDPKARTLTVNDNGIGMSRDELIENLGTIARSGTSAFLERLDAAQKGDINQIGQFGVGFYSAFMVAQMVEVASKQAGSDEAWSWRSDGKGEFSVEEDTRSQRGTSVTLYLRQNEDEFLNEDTLRGIITRYSNHIAIPIFVGTEEKPANRASALWLRPKSEITTEQYKEFYHHTAHAFEEPALTIHWRAEGKIEYTGLLFVPGMKPFDLFDPKRRHGIKLYVKRVFITDEAEGLVPAYLRFLRGIIDSEDLPLNVSREMLQNNPMISKIRQGVVRRVITDLTRMASENKEAYETFWQNFGVVLKEGIYEDAEHRQELAKLARASSTVSQTPVSFDEYISRMKEGQDCIYYINGDDPEAVRKSPHLEGFKAKGIEVLLLTDAVDDFWPTTLDVYEGKKFKSVTRAGQDLGKIASEQKQEENQTVPDQLQTDKLIAAIKLTLADRVKDVRTTERLTDSAVCLAADEGDLDIHLEKFLKQHNQIRTASQRILEINPKHALICSLAAKAETEGAKAEFADIIWLLFEQARLLDGENVTDIHSFNRRLGDVLSRAIAS